MIIRPVFPLPKMCRALEVSRSGYYAYKKRAKSQRRIDNEKLLIEIRRIFLDNNSNYGSPRIWNQLNNVELIRCSENRVAKVMREAKIIAIQKSKFRLTTNSKHDYPVWPYILCRNFTVDRPNAIWVSDIAYIWTFKGWLYLTTQAMNQAILQRKPDKGLILHSDRGSQYAGNNFKAILAQNKFIGSMSKKGDCWDNAVAESFIHTLKVECVHRNKFKTRNEAKIKIFEYVEMYYNCKRAHSTLGYVSPLEYERQTILS